MRPVKKLEREAGGRFYLMFGAVDCACRMC